MASVTRLAGVPGAREDSRRLRVRVQGIVQGVGFRPFVYRLARELGLAGHVLNDDRGVEIEVEGGEAALRAFLARLRDDAPPLAVVERVDAEAVPERGVACGFAILRSRRSGGADARVSSDSATCPDCLTELRDPADRRYRYPFINCTNCGPRFTIVRGVPYDRPLTTMAGFSMCARCRAEYEDPADRRFHAQPNACPACGPSLRLLDAGGAAVSAGAHRDLVEACAFAILDGAIAAIKGLGGYHLACLADHEAAVRRLRARKHRDDKPFALMAADLGGAARLVTLTPESEAVLSSPARPIVLAPRRRGAPVAASVAPRSADLGVMLPYSPLHHLLLADSGRALVMTSGNLSDEPIAYDDADALARLSAIADLFLVHDRPIETRTDDSVVRAVSVRGRGHAVPIRRSRGYVPTSLELPAPTPPLLACGAELKSTFCLAKERHAWVSHHIGDLKNWETLQAFRRGVSHFERLFEVTPQLVAHDLHPDYLSTRFALECPALLEPVAVQHHHAHLAACLAEHGRSGPAIGVIYDGSGYGPDGTVWGGELLVGELTGFERAGHLWPVRLPGADRAVSQPWRMACAWLVEACGDAPPRPRNLAALVDGEAWEAVARLAREGPNSPVTTSVGRLFDAVAALCGIRAVVSYEGQAAAELEALADPDERGEYPLAVAPDLRLDARELIRAVADDLRAGASLGAVSVRFHRALATATAQACAILAELHGMPTVVLAGGVFQNRLLLELSTAALDARRLDVILPERLPPNDGAVSYGQAAVAAATIAQASGGVPVRALA